MNDRTVAIEKYWTSVVRDTAEFQQIALALNSEFNKLLSSIHRVLKDAFIDDATEYGVSRWEKILKLPVAPTATLEERKVAILAYLSVKTPYTWRVMKQMLVPILGGEDKFVMEFVNDEGKLVLHTDRLDDTMLATVDDLLARVLPQNIEVERYNHHIEVSWRDLNRYAACKNYDEMNAVAQSYGFSSFREDMTSDGWWIYPMNSISGTSLNIQYFFGHYVSSSASKVIRGARILLPENTKYNASANFMAHCTNLEEVYLYAPTMLHNAGGFVYDCPKLTKAEVYVPIITNLKNWCAGCKSLSHFRFLTPLKNQLQYSQNTWKDCVLDVESVQNIAENMPTMTTLTTTTIGMHIDHKNDEAMLEALAVLEGKNWNIERQWNGTPTSGIATQDLEDIYVKVTASENGEYTDENGNRCSLSWGHYVTDSSEYTLFYSLVEAEQYFKLTRIENNE